MVMKITDLFGEEREIGGDNYDEPSEAWVEGWNCYMSKGLPDNPYPVDCYQHNEWQDGYDAAEMD